jgi:hypothetical protein
MEEELEFLLRDENILEADISDVVDRDGKNTIGIAITVGMSDEQVQSMFELVGEENVSKIPTGFEIILTKSDLKRINKLMKEYEY